MSADNYELCPRCMKDHPGADREQFRTFREDYEFYGADEGTIHADYRGRCNICDLEATLRAHQTFYRSNA